MKRKLLIILTVFFVVPTLILGISFAILQRHQQELTQKVIDSLNREFVGELTLERTGLAFFENFPYLSIDLKGVAFYVSKAQNSKPLYRFEDIYLGFNVLDLLSTNYTIKKIKVKQGHLDVIKFPNGDINILLAKGIKEEKTTEDSDLDLDLASIEIEKIDVSYRDLAMQTDYVIHVGKLESSVSMQASRLELETVGDLLFDLDYEGTHTFFSNKHVQLDLDLQYDLEKPKLTLNPSQIQLEEAFFAVSGTVDMSTELTDFDLKLEGQKPDFKMVAAFLPADLAAALNEYQNQGEVFFHGSVNGPLGGEQFPAISLEFGCEDAYFLNPEINKKVEKVRFTGFYTNGAERNLKTSELVLQNVFAKPDKGIFEGSLTVRNFEDPYVKIKLNADFDLGFVGEFLNLDGIDGIEGQVILSMDFDELVDLDASQASLTKIKKSVQSELTLRNLHFRLADYPYPIKDVNAHMVMEAGKITLDSLRLKIENSDFRLAGTISDFPAIIHGLQKPVDVKLQASAEKLDFGKLTNTPDGETVEDLSLKLSFAAIAQDLMHFDHLPKGEFFIDDLYAKLGKYPHTLHDFDADILIGDNELEVKGFKGEIDQSDFFLNGRVENFEKWFQDRIEGESTFEWDFRSKQLRINDLLTYNGVNYLPQSWRDEILSNLHIHGKVDLLYEGDLQSADLYLTQLEGKTTLHPLKLENFSGRIHYEPDYLLVENFGGKMGLSDFNIHMGLGLDSAHATKPDYFHFKANALDLDALMGFKSIEEDTNHQEAFNIFKIPFRKMEFKADIKKLNYHTYWLEDVLGRARTTEDHYLYLDTLGLRLADGNLGINGYFNGSNPDELYFSSKMQAEKLDIDKLLFKFENFGQDYLINENLHGKVSGTIDSKFRVYPDLTPIVDKSEAKMDLTVYQGSLVNFAPMSALAGYFSDKNLNRIRFDTLSNTFDLKGGVLHIPRMNINSSLGFIELSGTQGLDMKMDYFLRIPLGMVTQVGFRSLFGGKNKNEIDPDREDAIVYRDTDKRVRFVNINMTGTPDDYKIGLGKDRN
jgi:hypothetical protein